MVDHPAGTDLVTGALTAPAQIFCAAFVSNGGVANAAARVAGFNERTGSRLLKNPLVLARIAELRADVAAQLLLEESAVRAELFRIAFCELPDVYDYEGDEARPKAFSQLNEFARAALAGIEAVTTTTSNGKNTTVSRKCSVKLHDKVGALKAIGAMLGQVYDRLQRSPGQNAAATLAAEIDASQLSSVERMTLRELLLKAKATS